MICLVFQLPSQRPHHNVINTNVHAATENTRWILINDIYSKNFISDKLTYLTDLVLKTKLLDFLCEDNAMGRHFH